VARRTARRAGFSIIGAADLNPLYTTRANKNHIFYSARNYRNVRDFFPLPVRAMPDLRSTGWKACRTSRCVPPHGEGQEQLQAADVDHSLQRRPQWPYDNRCSYGRHRLGVRWYRSSDREGRSHSLRRCLCFSEDPDLERGRPLT
jgi:hypothetical protein